MANKALLVARREYLENLRTRTFWLSIVAVPVFIVITGFISFLAATSTSARTYAVVDRSGWLLGEIDRQAMADDLELALTSAFSDWRLGRKVTGDAPTPPAALAQELAGALGVEAPKGKIDLTALTRRDERHERALRSFAEATAGLIPVEEAAAVVAPSSVPGARWQEHTAALRDWYQQLEPKGVEALAFAKKRFLRVPTPEGADPLPELNRRVDSGELFAYFVLPADPLEGRESATYASKNLTDDDLKRWLARLADDAVRTKRLNAKGIESGVVAWANTPLHFAGQKIGAGGAAEEVRSEDLIRQWAPVVLVYLLVIAIFSISQMLLTNTIEEKASRVMEVLLSSVSAVELMAGKILGIAATGLTVVGTWVVFLIGGVAVLTQVVGATLPIDLGQVVSDPYLLPSFVGYFVLGYLFYAALLVAIGSVCNTLKEAQNLMLPITLAIMVPMATMIPVSRDPNGTLAKVLSYIPPFTPFVMMNRAAGPPTWVEYLVTTALLLAAVAATLWAAAKVFRIGVLMTGKPPSVIEILRWVKAPVGRVEAVREVEG
ncbi:MAG TPA: ABC transporter permease [Thermoanaerobaculia bacterium]|nr:ABC transporter permease [Thermoanaerobaculia bacterium]